MWDLGPHPCPGIEPMPPALEAQSLNQWTTRESLFLFTVRFIVLCLHFLICSLLKATTKISPPIC